MAIDFALGVRLRWAEEDVGNHAFSVVMQDADGKIIFQAPVFNVLAQLSPEMEDFGLSWAPSMRQIKILSFGDHTIDLIVDEKVVASTPLYVKRPSENLKKMLKIV